MASVARRRQKGRQRAVLVKAEKQSDDNGQPATAENVRAENTVLRAEHEQSTKNPKGNVTLIATSHKKPPVLAAGVCIVSKVPAVFFFLLHNIPKK